MTTESEWMAATQPWERHERFFDTPDDLEWVIDTTVPQAAGNGYQSAVVYGAESNLSRVDFYLDPEPTIDMAPDFIWFRPIE